MKKALYRKYRPTKLSNVVGQSQIVETLSNAIKNDKISHAYLFTGPRGTGKTSVARIFAHAINNFDYSIEDNYLDIIEIDAASNTGVDNIRELREKATIAPSIGKYKIYIIDEVHMLSKSAFNALLKTLEEPPKHVVFIMATTDAHKVPITITSRAQTFNFKLADPETMTDFLQKVIQKEKINIDEDALSIIVKRGGGSFRDTLSLLDQLATMSSNEKLTKEKIIESIGLPEDKIITDLLSAYSSQNQKKIVEILKESISRGIKPEILSEEIIKYIIEQADPTFFPLLEKLPSVTNPFPEAKLLLAFVKNHKIAATTTKQPETKVQNLTVKDSSNPKKEKTQSIPEPKDIAPESAEINDVQKTMNPQTFSWESYVDIIKSKNSTLSQTLSRDVEHKIDGKTLHLYPKNKFIYSRLSKKDNKQMLLDQVEDMSIEIHEHSNTKSPINSKISDIMGGEVEEIQENGGEDIF